MKEIIPYFGKNPLDRLDLVRRDENEFTRIKNLENSLFLLFHNGELLFDKEEKYLFSKEHLDTQEAVLLGEYENTYYFALYIQELSEDFIPRSLREIAEENLVKEEFLGVLAQGAAVLNWHQSHQYCPFCGNKTHMVHAGWQRDCLTCKKEHFPRVDPVVIMLVTFQGRCLVGRGAHFPSKRYSSLAGYMESGESIEDAARRELYEEAGVKGTEVKYLFCQPWPFPSTLMIGLHVKAKSQELRIDKEEIADAKWLDKKEVERLLQNDTDSEIQLPSHLAISRNLLEWWIQNDVD
jgi:NAD+ diphosphatase